uniref:Uncharacterized protein n=1 Tax=Solanum lycopersicum TaxID=4081 RepID=A0A3Q7GRK6_SOLLC
MLFHVVGPPPRPPSPFSPVPFPHRAHEKATPTDDTEILGVYGINSPIQSVNAPPRKKAIMSNIGEGTFEVRSKRLNVELVTRTFCVCARTSTRIARVVKEHENLLCM